MGKSAWGWFSVIKTGISNRLRDGATTNPIYDRSTLHYRWMKCNNATIGEQILLYVICGCASCLGDTIMASLVPEMEVSFAVEIRGRIAYGRRRLAW